MRLLDPVARRYARALFGAAEEREGLETVADGLDAVAGWLRTEAQARWLLAAPMVPIAEKQALVVRLFGAHVHPLICDLLELLLEKRRYGLLEDVREAFRALLDERQGLQRVRVTSAVALPEDLAGRLRSALAARTGKRVILEPRLDPRLIGGLRVQIEDEVIEHSVQKTLENLRATLQGAELGGARG